MNIKVQIVVSIADLKEFALEISNEVLSKYIESTKKRYYTRKEVCDILYITLPTLWSLVKKGKLSKKKVGTRCLYDADSIDELVNKK